MVHGPLGAEFDGGEPGEGSMDVPETDRQARAGIGDRCRDGVDGVLKKFGGNVPAMAEADFGEGEAV
ncbi:MAG: hypothetical protein R2762_17380 [Bryobacteraceae bacterium]